MNREAVQAFVDRVNEDETFRDGLIAASDHDARLRMAQEAGFDVTADDFAEIRSRYGVDELSDDDLQKIAGGLTPTSQDWIVTLVSGVGAVTLAAVI